MLRSAAPHASPIADTSLCANTARYCHQRVSQRGRHRYAHLRHIDAEELVTSRRQVDGNPCKFCVFVNGAESAPSASLDQPIISVKVEALLPIPALRSGGSGVGGHRREPLLWRKHERLNPDPDRVTLQR